MSFKVEEFMEFKMQSKKVFSAKSLIYLNNHHLKDKPFGAILCHPMVDCQLKNTSIYHIILYDCKDEPHGRIFQMSLINLGQQFLPLRSVDIRRTKYY